MGLRRRARPRHERDAVRAIRRLEAFSDIVIGFTLAQLGLSLVLPAHALDFVTRPGTIFAFVVTFVVVVRYWWVADAVFETYFVPTRLLTGLSFAALACLTLAVFTLQLYLHFVPLGEGVVASRISFGFFAAAYGAQGMLLAGGLFSRFAELTAGARRAGVRLLCARSFVVLGITLGNVYHSFGTAYVVSSVDRGAKYTENYRPPPGTVIADLPSSLLAGWLLGALVGIAVGYVVTRSVPSLRDAPPEPAGA